VKFEKPPTPPPPGPPPEKPERDRRRRRDADTPQSMAAMEAREMHKYHKECNEIYNKLKGLGVEMEIQPLVEGKTFDKDSELYPSDDQVLALEIGQGRIGRRGKPGC